MEVLFDSIYIVRSIAEISVIYIGIQALKAYIKTR